jgi:hypothetical protein
MGKLLRERDGRLEAEDIPFSWRIQKKSRFSFEEITDFDYYIAKMREEKGIEMERRAERRRLEEVFVAKSEAEDRARRTKGFEDFACYTAGAAITGILAASAIPYTYCHLNGGDFGEKTIIMAGTSLAFLAAFGKCAYEAGRYAWNWFLEKTSPVGFVMMDMFLRDKYPDTEHLLENGYGAE